MKPTTFACPLGCLNLLAAARAAVVCAVSLLLTAPASAQERPAAGGHGSQTAATQHYIVTLRSDAPVKRVTGELKLKTRHTYQNALRGFAAELDAGQVAELKKRGDVLAVEPDGRAELCAQTNGAGIIRMGLTNFPIARINGLDERIDVDVAVIDTGIQLDHPDLNVFRAVDVTGTGTNGNDLNGHGTHVAGIIGALDNDFGVVGVAPGARLWSVRISRGATSSLNWSDILAGFDYVAQHSDEIEVANCSFGSNERNLPAVAIRQAVSNLVHHGVVVVAGTGNFISDIIGSDRQWGTGDDVYPAALREVMAVSNVNPTNDTFSLTSCYSSYERPGNFVVSSGGAIDVAAPGVGILSTYTNSSYSIFSGTSMACAHASGLVALYIAEYGRAHSAPEVYAIRQRIVDCALPQSQWHTDFTEETDDFPEPMALAIPGWVPVAGVVPVLTTKPQHQTAVPGSNATFHAVAAGSPPLRSQWRFNGTNLADNGRITGSAGNDLAIAGVLTTDFGNYQLVVTNAYGAVTSAPVKLSLPPDCVSAWSGLVAWWRAESNALDSVSTNHGTLSGATFAGGEAGQAFNLDGRGNKIIVPALNFGGRNGMTIEAWIKPIGQLAYADQAILRQGSAATPDWVFKFKLIGENAQLSFGLNAGGAYDQLNVPVAAADFDYRDGNWHHVAATYDGSMRRLYKDGVEIGAGPKTGNISFAGSQQVIGGDPFPQANPTDIFQGLIDELAVFDRALSASEIQAIYDAGSAGKCVNSPSPVLHATLTNGMLTLAWDTLPGRSYQLEYNTNLVATNWVGLGAAVQATNSTVNALDLIGPGQQRFYRVSQPPAN